ncbi:MAG: adenylyl-sulfate kinase [Candidatus Dadabacteria bacterium]|nr:adenylyl-sulfate kinase [Candidatus Dadabacteria bacterium]TDI90638.1 MAG: adenylyl-sulfate kinase [Candidatus Dadabacteria bacterium]TDI99300.1 MAG: adenylyl-sulfate kinase [Candidatus Dadabacteria bacterium]
MERFIIPHEHEITKGDRRSLNNHGSLILWFTGLPSSGKSTIANELEKKLITLGTRTYILDGDNVRMGLCKDLGFSEEDRGENIRRIGEVSKLFIDAGCIVLSAFVSPYIKDRDAVRELVEEGEFVEVFVDAPLEVCEERDVKGLYKKAREGIIKGFTGIDDPYEAPLNPEITIDTSKLSLDEGVNVIFDYLEKRGVLPTN